MSQSSAARLQHAALRVASKTDIELDLTKSTPPDHLFEGVLQARDLSGGHVLVFGTGDGSIPALAAARVAAGARLTVVDSEQANLDHLREHLVGQVHTDGDPEAAAIQLVRAPFHDIQTNPSFLDTWLAEHPVTDRDMFFACQAALEEQRTQHPLIAADMFDLVIVNQAIHRVSADAVAPLLAETFRVLRPGGRVMVFVLLADEQPPANILVRSGKLALQYVPHETELRDVLVAAGYYGVTYTWRGDVPAKVLSGVELRPFVVEAYKDRAGTELDCGHALVYRGPWREVVDDYGRRYVRGERTAVGDITYQRLTERPYQDECVRIPCYLEMPKDQAPPFDSAVSSLRDPQVTKGKLTVFDARSSGCDPASGCC